MPSGYSVLEYQGDGVTTVFAVNFTLGYLKKSDIYCRVGDEVDGSGNPAYRVLEDIPGDPGRMRVLGAVPTASQKVLFRRITAKTTLQNDYADGEALDDDALDNSFKQQLMIAHELLDGFGLSTVYSDIDLTGHTIRNILTDDTDPTSAASIGAVVTARDAALAAQTASELAQAGAEAAEALALADRIAAAASALAAANSATAAHNSELAAAVSAGASSDSADAAAASALEAAEVVAGNITMATESSPGRVQLSTDADALAGMNAEKAITPKNLKVVADTKVPLSAFTAAWDFLVGSGPGAYIKKTMAEVWAYITGNFSGAYTKPQRSVPVNGVVTNGVLNIDASATQDILLCNYAGTALTIALPTNGVPGDYITITGNCDYDITLAWSSGWLGSRPTSISKCTWYNFSARCLGPGIWLFLGMAESE